VVSLHDAVNSAMAIGVPEGRFSCRPTDTRREDILDVVKEIVKTREIATAREAERTQINWADREMRRRNITSTQLNGCL
jgi:hypothetical protein